VMTGRGVHWGVTIGVPMASRYTPSVTAASGTYLARPVACGLDIRFLAVSSGFGHQVSVVPAWRVDEGVIVSLAV
jgi:hypothetical protein